MNKTMIKIGVCLGFYIGLMTGLTSTVNLILLHLHEIEFYYTIEGLKWNLVAAVIEAAIIIPFTRLYFEKVLGTKKFYQIFGEDDEKEEEP